MACNSNFTWVSNTLGGAPVFSSSVPPDPLHSNPTQLPSSQLSSQHYHSTNDNAGGVAPTAHTPAPSCLRSSAITPTSTPAFSRVCFKHQFSKELDRIADQRLWTSEMFSCSELRRTCTEQGFDDDTADKLVAIQYATQELKGTRQHRGSVSWMLKCKLKRGFEIFRQPMVEDIEGEEILGADLQERYGDALFGSVQPRNLRDFSGSESGMMWF